jgi:hypothetical protein
LGIRKGVFRDTTEIIPRIRIALRLTETIRLANVILVDRFSSIGRRDIDFRFKQSAQIDQEECVLIPVAWNIWDSATVIFTISVL